MIRIKKIYPQVFYLSTINHNYIKKQKSLFELKPIRKLRFAYLSGDYGCN